MCHKPKIIIYELLLNYMYNSHFQISPNFVWTEGQDSSKGQQYTLTALYCRTLQNPIHTQRMIVSGWVSEWVSEWMSGLE